MSRLKWGDPGSKFYEVGIDRGVFYPIGSSGVPWDGLTNVTTRDEGADVESFYLDGVKYLEISQNADFAGEIEAFSSPSEMAVYDGYARVGSALFIGQQPRQKFGMSYRTLIGSDAKGTEQGYKLHMVYNVLAIRGDDVYSTIGEDVEPTKITWSFTTTPLPVQNMRPAGHLVVVSTANPSFTAALETLLWGSSTVSPQLPSPQEVVNLLATF